MTESVYSFMDQSCEALKLDFSGNELAQLATEQNFSAESMEAIRIVFERLCEKKEQATVQMLLRTSRLPPKERKDL